MLVLPWIFVAVSLATFRTTYGADTTEWNTDCNPDQFHCSSTDECIHELWRCDGEQDCALGEDEAWCLSGDTTEEIMTQTPSPRAYELETTCSPEDFVCPYSKKCIPENWVCDGEEDCIYREDETNCDTSTTTLPHTLRFRQQTTTRQSTTTRISTIPIRNSETTYRLNTVPAEGICPIGEFHCSSSQECIPQSMVCDNAYHCRYGEDELDCEISTSPGTYVENSREPPTSTQPSIETNDPIPSSGTDLKSTVEYHPYYIWIVAAFSGVLLIIAVVVVVMFYMRYRKNYPPKKGMENKINFSQRGNCEGEETKSQIEDYDAEKCQMIEVSSICIEESTENKDKKLKVCPSGANDLV